MGQFLSVENKQYVPTLQMTKRMQILKYINTHFNSIDFVMNRLWLMDDYGVCKNKLNKLSVEKQIELYEYVFDKTMEDLSNYLIKDLSDIITVYCGRDRCEENIMLNEWSKFEEYPCINMKFFLKYINIFPCNFYIKNLVITRKISHIIDEYYYKYSKHVNNIQDINTINTILQEYLEHNYEEKAEEYYRKHNPTNVFIAEENN